MVEVVYLVPNEEMPEVGDEERWITIDANPDGRFFGSGWSRKRSGESVFYRSLADNDASLDAAIAAATEWAEKYSVPTIWVQREPWDPNSD
jgi:hypothetical protein